MNPAANPPYSKGDGMDRSLHGDDWGAETAGKYTSSSGKARGSAKGANLYASTGAQDSFRERSFKTKMEHIASAPTLDRGSAGRSPLKQKSYANDDAEPYVPAHDHTQLDASLIHYRDAGDFIDEGVKVVRTKTKAKSRKSTNDITPPQKAAGRSEVELASLDAQDRKEQKALRRTQSHKTDKHHVSKPEPPPETRWPDYPEEDQYVEDDPHYPTERETQSASHHPKKAATASPAENQEGSTSRARRRPQVQVDTDANHRQEIVKPKEQAPEEDAEEM
jgi:hypothetical protein